MFALPGCEDARSCDSRVLRLPDIVACIRQLGAVCGACRACAIISGHVQSLGDEYLHFLHHCGLTWRRAIVSIISHVYKKLVTLSCAASPGGTLYVDGSGYLASDPSTILQ